VVQQYAFERRGKGTTPHVFLSQIWSPLLPLVLFWGEPVRPIEAIDLLSRLREKNDCLPGSVVTCMQADREGSTGRGVGIFQSTWKTLTA